MIVTYCASQMLQFVSHCGRGGNVCVPVHVRMGLRQLVHLLADEGCVCVGCGGRGVGRNHVYHMLQVLSFCQVAVMVMTVFMCTVEVYGNLYIFQLMKGEVLAAAALLPLSLIHI